MREALPMTIALRLPNIASMRSINFAAIAAAAVIGTILVAGCDPASGHASLPVASTPSLPVASTPASDSATTGPAAGTSRTVTATSEPQIPISVESDSQMKAAGNDGPSSSILLPTSCQLTGTTITAQGMYTNGGFVPNVYNRYGDIIVLYVFASPSPGYAAGMQLGASDVSESPVLGSRAPWHVSLSISPSLGAPARCVVAAHPTHDGQFAP